MAGRGPAPKPADLRQRRNKASTNAHLPSEADSAENEVPDLPPLDCEDDDGSPVDWHPMVTEWWDSVWRSPMASEFVESDKRGGLFELALLRQGFWTATSRTGRLEAAREIRLQDVRFGLDAISRRRLQWEIDRGEEAAEKTKSRRVRKSAKPSKDPRGVLKVV